jgi:hypothetical protein
MIKELLTALNIRLFPYNTNSRSRHNSQAARLVRQLQFTLAVNLTRGDPIMSIGTALLIAFGLHRLSYGPADRVASATSPPRLSTTTDAGHHRPAR